MPVFDLFSKRQAQLRGGQPDVYSYDTAPQKLRVQIVHVLNDSLGSETDYYGRPAVKDSYEFVASTLCREYGIFQLSPPKSHGDSDTLHGHVQRFILYEQDVERLIDAIELCFNTLQWVGRDYNYRRRSDASEEVDASVSELNIRFQENAFGYRYEERQIIRIDSELVHVEVVKPALKLLQEPVYKGAQDEFLEAHRHFRHGATKEALNSCLKALESTMKAIAAKRGWTHSPTAVASVLIDLMIEKELIPSFWSNHFTGIRTMLTGGVPTVRNELGGHGQGPDIVEVPMNIAAFAIHQAAAAIVFLAEAERELAP
jgi:hypothetical protein